MRVAGTGTHLGIYVVALALLLAAAPAAAQINGERLAPIWGNWELRLDHPRGELRGRTAFSRDGAAAIAWSTTGGQALDYFQSIEIVGDTIRGASVDGRFEVRLAGQNSVATGRWRNVVTSWHRIMENVERVDLEPGSLQTLDFSRLRSSWGGVTMDGNLPTIRLRLSGTGLPFHPNDARMVTFDDPGLRIPATRLFPAEEGRRLDIEVALSEPRQGPQTLWLNGRPVVWTLRLPGTPCTALALTVERTTYLVGEFPTIRGQPMPPGCDAERRDVLIEFASSDTEIIRIQGIRYREPAVVPMTPVRVIAVGAGRAQVTATLGAISSAVDLTVERRQPCTAMHFTAEAATVAVGGTIALDAISLDEFAVDRAGRGQLGPDECAVSAPSRPSVVLDRPDRARLHDDSMLTGLAPGPLRLTRTLGNLSATLDIEVVAPPPCDRLELRYPQHQIGVGEIAGTVYRGLPNLLYSRAGTTEGQAAACEKPPGAPYFESITANPSVQVDRSSGALTGLRPGRTRIAVAHAPLFAFYDISVTAAGTPCTEVNFYFPSRLAVGDRHSIERPVYFGPGGDHSCRVPPGRPTFTVAPPGRLVVSADGEVGALMPGPATLELRHGPVVARQDVEVLPPQPCDSLTAHFEPPQAQVWQRTRLVLTYHPSPCVRPDGSPRSIPIGLFATDYQRDAIEVNVLPGARAGSNLIVPVAVTVTHGDLVARAALQVLPNAGCRVGTVVVRPDRIAPGELAEITVATRPAGCTPRIRLVGPDDMPVQLEPGSRPFQARGVHGGAVTFEASGYDENWRGLQPVSGQLTVVAPPCETMTARYFPEVIPIRGYAAPQLDYRPEGCTRPPGPPTFASDAPATIAPIETLPAGDRRRMSMPQGIGYVVRRAGTSGNPGSATITITHGSLTARASVATSD